MELVHSLDNYARAVDKSEWFGEILTNMGFFNPQ